MQNAAKTQQKHNTCFSAAFPLKSIEPKTQRFAFKKVPDPFQITHRVKTWRCEP
ncbi:unnamed protein product, partial [Staurois parvus]